MGKIWNIIKKQVASYNQYKADLVATTADAQIKAFIFVGVLLFLCSIADYTVLYQSEVEDLTGFKIKVLLVCYFLLAPIIMYYLKRYKKNIIIYVAYLNIIVALLAVLFGPIFDAFKLSLSELFALILVPAFTVFGPNIIYQIIILAIIIMDAYLEVYYISSNNIWLHMVYYLFDSISLYGMVSFVNYAVVRNKTKELKMWYELKHISETDGLTGLLNRKALINEIEKYEKMAGTYGMIVIDLDDFKQINDTYGHIKGDEILKNMGNALKMTFSDQEIITRFGGDEFMVFLPLIKDNVIFEKLKLLKVNFEKINTEFKERTYSVGYSVIKYNKDMDLYRVLFNEADENMYKQKMIKKV